MLHRYTPRRFFFVVPGVFLLGLFLTTTMHAQERGPSVSVKIINAGTVQGDAVVILPRQKDDAAPVANSEDSSTTDRPREYGMDDFIQDGTPPWYNPRDLGKQLVFPAEAEEKGLTGKVSVSVQIDSDGTPLQVVVRKSSDKIFEKSVIDAVMSIDYSPGYVKDEPVRMWLPISVHFD